MSGWDWRGKTVLITGAGNGLGQTLAVALSQRGVGQLLLCDLTSSGLTKTADSCAGSTQVQTFAFDVRDSEAMGGLLRTAGAIDVAYLNAGVMERPGFSPEDFDAATIQRIIDIDLTSVIVGTMQVAKAMLGEQQRGGAIVLTASMGAFLPMPPTPVYAAAKSGVVHFTRSAARLVDGRGVRVMAVCPSYTETAMLLDSTPDESTRELMRGEVGGRFLSPEEVVAGMIEIVEIGRAGDVMRITVRGGRDFGPKAKSKL